MSEENKIRIIVKTTFQPPIDTPASITYNTIVVESKELAEYLNPQKHRTAQVIGAELIKEED